MEEIFNFVCLHAHHAEYIFLGLLLLAGVNVPISEDLLLLTAGALVSRCIPDNYLQLYLWMFFGCWISGFEAYWLGRLFGPKLYELPGFRHIVNPKRIEKLHYYYEKFGIWTFIVGRFIPGGVRNALFITAGMGKMPFPLFMLRDFVAAAISTNVIFYLGYAFGERYEAISSYFKRYNEVAFLILALLIAALLIRIWWRLRRRKVEHDDHS